MSGFTKVLPLRSGLSGVNALGESIELQVGIPAWMPEGAAVEAERAGDVDLLAGKTFDELRSSTYHTTAAKAEEESAAPKTTRKKVLPKTQKGTYNRRDMRAEP